MQSYVQDNYQHSPIIILGGTSDYHTLHSLDGWWQKEMYTYDMLENISDENLLSEFIFIGINKRTYNYYEKRNGIGVLLEGYKRGFD